MTDLPNKTAPANGATPSKSLALRTSNEPTADPAAGDRDSTTFYGPWFTEAAPTDAVADYPTPRALLHQTVFEWDEGVDLVVNFAALGAALAEAGDLYRNTPYAGGLQLASGVPNIPPAPIRDARPLAAIIVDRIRVRRTKDGKFKGHDVPSDLLATMLRSEAFLQQFRPVDEVQVHSRYLPDFTLTCPGYNDGGYGQRVLHVGTKPWVEPGTAAIRRFLDVMDFATEADRTNAVAAALTVHLRNHWPGAKPLLAVTSTKSHGGKETIVSFAAGTTRHVSVSYEWADWALQKAVVAALKQDPEIGLVDVDNARLDRGAREIKSAYLERFLTDSQPLLFSPGTGPPVPRRADVVVAITTNHGTLSEDLLNRALPIHLAPVGDVARRVSPIGNPRHEYLPANRERSEAEERGMVERWRAEGRPLDLEVRHPFGPWARTIGGILMVNGFDHFLANYGVRKTADDPLRQGLGLLGAARPGEWLPSRAWAIQVSGLGLVRRLIPEGDRDTDKGIERGIGVVLSAHRAETFAVETEDERLALRLARTRRRFEVGSEPSTRYRFAVLERHALPADGE